MTGGTVAAPPATGNQEDAEGAVRAARAFSGDSPQRRGGAEEVEGALGKLQKAG
jgi:hypothetical protein